MRSVGATLRSALAEALANRRAFAWQVAVMVVNDLAWVAFWVLFFNRAGTIRGWDTDRVLMLLSILATTAGVVLGVLANARRIGHMAAEGDLDAALALPTPPLGHLLVRRVSPVNLGDLVFGPLLFLAIGDLTAGRVAIYAVGVVVSSTILTGFLVAAGSMAFFSGRGEASDAGFHAVMLLANYPADIFSTGAKVLLYTAVPAALIGAAPATLVDDFDPVGAAALIGAAAVFAGGGWALFTLGLRHYSSGSAWTRA